MMLEQNQQVSNQSHYECVVCHGPGRIHGDKYEDWHVCGKCARLIAAAWYLGRSGEIPIELRDPIDEQIFGPCVYPLPAPSYVKKPIPSKLRWEIFQRDNYTCLKCGSKSDITVDHVDPEKNGGAATFENLQTLCRSCNSKKGAK